MSPASACAFCANRRITRALAAVPTKRSSAPLPDCPNCNSLPIVTRSTAVPAAPLPALSAAPITTPKRPLTPMPNRRKRLCTESRSAGTTSSSPNIISGPWNEPQVPSRQTAMQRRLSFPSNTHPPPPAMSLVDAQPASTATLPGASGQRNDDPNGRGNSPPVGNTRDSGDADVTKPSLPSRATPSAGDEPTSDVVPRKRISPVIKVELVEGSVRTASPPSPSLQSNPDLVVPVPAQGRSSTSARDAPASAPPNNVETNGLPSPDERRHPAQKQAEYPGQEIERNMRSFLQKQRAQSQMECDELKGKIQKLTDELHQKQQEQDAQEQHLLRAIDEWKKASGSAKGPSDTAVLAWRGRE